MTGTTPSGATPTPQLLRDPNTGAVVLPGRCIRTVTDPMLKGGGIDTAWWQLVQGTQTQGADMLGGHFMARNVVATPAVTGQAAALRSASTAVFTKITPDSVEALELTLESVSADTDTGWEIQVGFPGTVTNKGGAFYFQGNGTTQAAIRTYDASNVLTELLIPTAFTTGVNGTGTRRRNLTFLLLPHGYAGQTGASSGWTTTAFVLQDDQCVASAVLPNFDSTLSVWPQFALTCRDGVAHNFSWAQTRLRIAHN